MDDKLETLAGRYLNIYTRISDVLEKSLVHFPIACKRNNFPGKMKLPQQLVARAHASTGSVTPILSRTNRQLLTSGCRSASTYDERRSLLRFLPPFHFKGANSVSFLPRAANVMSVSPRFRPLEYFHCRCDVFVASRRARDDTSCDVSHARLQASTRSAASRRSLDSSLPPNSHSMERAPRPGFDFVYTESTVRCHRGSQAHARLYTA